MTQHGGPSGSSNPLQTLLPVRPTSNGPATTNEHNDQHIQIAVSKGKDIGESLANILRRSSLADNEQSNLHQVVSLAEELRNYQFPAEFTVGLVGDSGVGKSSLINSLLGQEDLAKTSGGGSACTTAVYEYRKKRETDSAAYTVEVERMGNPEIDDLLRQSVLDYRRYHLRDQNDDEGAEGGELEQQRKQAGVAWDTLTAAFENRGCTEALFQNALISTEEIIRRVLDWRDDITWPAGFNTTNIAILTAGIVGDCTIQIENFWRQWMWPFIKVVRIYLDAAVLQNGIVLVDLPGFRDVNSARVRIAEVRLYQCDEVFVVTDIVRAATNQGVEDVIVRQLGRNFSGLRRSQNVAIICTMSEVCQNLGKEEEILRDCPHTEKFNTEAMKRLQLEVDDREEEHLPWRQLAAKRERLFISARNQHVERLLVRHYAAQSQARTVCVFCVSNKRYRDATKLRAVERQGACNRRRSSIHNDKILAADQMEKSSGILELRDFIRGIPSKSHILETKHFLRTSLVALLEKTELWLNASVVEVAASQTAAPGFVQELQTQLKRRFKSSVETGDAELTTAKTQMLQRPLTQGINRWEAAALAVVSRYQGWPHQTFLAFWGKEGAHRTASRAYTNWNEEIIQAMVNDIEPFEEPFTTESERIFAAVNDSTKESLSALPRRLSEFQGAEDFIATFPRRERDLEYEIDNISDWFIDELEIIFHDLFRAHGASYTMQHMRPMYEDMDYGSGVKQRRIQRLQIQISGDARQRIPKLFKFIRDQCKNSLSTLVVDTKVKLKRAVDDCRLDIRNDLEIVQGEQVPAEDESALISQMFDVLQAAKIRRAEALRVFEASIRD